MRGELDSILLKEKYMLHTHTEQGDMGWTCPKCKKENIAHVSHPKVEHPVDEGKEVISSKSRIDAHGVTHTQTATTKGEPIMHTGVIALPPCECGTRTFLNASFSDEDLEARNMREPIFEEGDALEPKIIGWNKTESHAVAHRHMALAKQMKDLGKDKPQTSPPGTP
jgi:hypothetical protein